jgi:hypothetical protein
VIHLDAFIGFSKMIIEYTLLLDVLDLLTADVDAIIGITEVEVSMKVSLCIFVINAFKKTLRKLLFLMDDE